MSTVDDSSHVSSPLSPVPETAPSPRRRRVDLRLWLPLGVLLLIGAASVLGPGLLDLEPEAQDLGNRLQEPVWLGGDGGALGTDAFGRDLLARTLAGGQVSLAVGFGAATGAVLLGVLLGLVAGYRGGRLDRAIMSVADVWLAFPFLVLALAAVAVVGSDIPVLIALLTLGGWVLPTRVTRTIVQRLRGEDYVVAATGAGASDAYVVWRHLLPQVLPVTLVVWSFTVGTLVVIESSLSFLGLGVRPPTPSWGNLISDGTSYLETAWWILTWPALMIVVTVLCANALGTALRRRLNDVALDPKVLT
ncbi:ABC transporter permease [Nocardioides sp. zg-ZUI104]|uniref:ABC transporter permease n=1 Tax=Nocardioides faecalis TaxID=2803858 RepID=UPI001BCDDE0B|nr:ABC transporter permease [Nocardioides faecalis]MBS4753848.1 ABC transporter permease [Nocardioides faecalis]